MAYISNIVLAVFCIIAASACEASPTRDTVAEKRNMDAAKNDGFLRIPSWLRSAVESMKPLAVNNNIHENVNKENPFVRSKRSTYATSTNLTQLLIDLNTQLNHSQYIGLNPEETAAPFFTDYTCPSNAVGGWWPGTEDRLISTCPWNYERVDLGENAFPRYVMNAVCICPGCLNSTNTTMCKELTYNMTYFKRTGFHDGLAVMETATYSLDIGCFCREANPTLTVANTDGQ